MSKSNSFFPPYVHEVEQGRKYRGGGARAGGEPDTGEKETNYDFPPASELAISWEAARFYQSLKQN